MISFTLFLHFALLLGTAFLGCVLMDRWTKMHQWNIAFVVLTACLLLLIIKELYDMTYGYAYVSIQPGIMPKSTDIIVSCPGFNVFDMMIGIMGTFGGISLYSVYWGWSR